MKTKIVLFTLVLATSFAWATDLQNLPAGATDLYFKPRVEPALFKSQYTYQNKKENLMEETMKQKAVVDALSSFLMLSPEKQKEELEHQKKLLEVMKAIIEKEQK